MTFSDFLQHIYSSSLFQESFNLLKSGENFSVTGLGNSASTILISGLFSAVSGQFIVIVPDYKTIETIHADLETLTGLEFNYFPSYRGLHLEDKPINKDIKLSRLKFLQNIISGSPGIYLVEARSLITPVISRSRFKSNLIEIEKGAETDFDSLVYSLVEQGFHRETMVSDFGEISVRGGIVDIFSPSMLEPVRIEFEYDTVGSIRVFDINNQRSTRQIDSVTIVPPLHDSQQDRQHYFPDPEDSLLSYFSGDTPVFFHQPVRAQKAVSEYIDHWQDESEYMNQLTSSYSAQYFKKIEQYLTDRSSSYIRNTFTAPKKSYSLNFNAKTLPQFNRNLKMFSRYIADIQKDYTNLVVGLLCDNKGQADRLRDIILDEDLIPSHYFIHVGSLEEGFIYPDGETLLINDHELFSRKHFKKPKQIYRARRLLLDDLSLKIGDYVVHFDHGIGRYLGLNKIKIRNSEQEALKIQYRDGDMLFLNIEKLPHLEKYTGQDGYQPELSKLGSKDWERLKQRTKRSVRNITHDLLEIYAKRENAQGIAFSADTQWQRELEASFQYDETPDQFKAVWEIKKDMETDRPMDRLVCGDVGFGKTEVALRAAFKAVNDSKQVAILVPTTILAQQHYETFRERLAYFPIEIEMLSRFRTTKEQKKIVAGLKDGTIDIVIGTHRLISKDVSFKRLGLLIIDEEQRFGVTHKEKIKKIRAEIDVLTLTATPIPRTLHMSLLGVRDLSTISTPPKNRLPIITEISEYDEDLIRAAIMKELDRGGQIYFVHNRVQTIQKIVHKLEKIVPESTYGIAHGQMKERELEQVMFSFLREDFNCLVSTMIIESGLDIPTVNTIIINQADNFGLAQLYQLRGRVGRSDIQAFAYLLTPPFERMTDVAISRLQTLSEHTELGSGFQIAMKDLEIRGAGNLLGAEQSGHINAVGFDMYTRLVKETVSEQLKKIHGDYEQEPIPAVQEVKIDTDISAYLPEDYIPDQFQRVSFYRKLASIETQERLDELHRELRDRFGPPPHYAENLLKLINIKLKSASLLMYRCSILDNVFTGTFSINSQGTTEQKEQLALLVSKFVDTSHFSFRIKQDENLKVELPLPEDTVPEKLDTVLEFLNMI